MGSPAENAIGHLQGFRAYLSGIACGCELLDCGVRTHIKWRTTPTLGCATRFNIKKGRIKALSAKRLF